MKVVNTVREVKEFVLSCKQEQQTIGFVPTMGALHAGHISLINKAKADSNKVICSIFINPIQFNDLADLEKYPRTLGADLRMLEEAGCDLVFVPSVKEMYPEEVKEHYSFGGIENHMEGEFRPGHFNGVAVVVKRFFEIVEPQKAFFGEKDFQQWAVICKLVESYRIPVEIIACSVMREIDGLAISSRNVRLTQQERVIAPSIYQALLLAKERAQKGDSVQKIKEQVAAYLKEISVFRMEYFEVIDDKTLFSVDTFSDNQGVVGCIAVWLGSVRLIDMIRFV